MLAPRADLARQLTVLALAVAMPLASFVPMVTGWGVEIGERSTEFDRTAVTPAAYAFSIWGIIFFAALAYAGYQALPAQRTDRVLRSVGWLTAGGFAATLAWSILAQAGAPNTLLAVILALIVAPLVVALLRLARASLSPQDRVLVALPIGLFAGWVSVAVFANASTALASLGVGGDLVGAVLLAIAGAFATWVVWRSGHGRSPYAAAVVWGLVAVVVADVPAGYPVAAVAAALAVVAIVGALVRAVFTSRDAEGWRDAPRIGRRA